MLSLQFIRDRNIYQVFKAFKYLSCVVGNSGFIVLQRAPLGAQQGRQAASRHLFHEDLEVAIFTARAQVLYYVLVAQARM